MPSKYYEKYKAYSLFNSLTDKYLFASINGMARFTINDFKARYPNDDVCLDRVFKARYRDIRWCPKCRAETKFYRVKKRQSYACMHCGYQLFPLANTIFRKTTTPLWSWFYAIYLVSVAKNGISAKELERHLDISYPTAWRMLKQIRLLMNQDELKLIGIVEADETYIGGRTEQARSYANKVPVIGVAEKRGKLKARTIDGANSTNAKYFVTSNVEAGAVLHTDQSKIYQTWVRNYYHHRTVEHSPGHYAENGIHTNNLEGFWSQLKRGLVGTYNGAVSPKYLDFYVSEFVFRYNHRFEPVCPVLLARAVKPVQ